MVRRFLLGPRAGVAWICVLFFVSFCQLPVGCQECVFVDVSLLTVGSDSSHGACFFHKYQEVVFVLFSWFGFFFSCGSRDQIQGVR